MTELVNCSNFSVPLESLLDTLNDDNIKSHFFRSLDKPEATWESQKDKRYSCWSERPKFYICHSLFGQYCLSHKLALSLFHVCKIFLVLLLVLKISTNIFKEEKNTTPLSLRLQQYTAIEVWAKHWTSKVQKITKDHLFWALTQTVVHQKMMYMVM